MWLWKRKKGIPSTAVIHDDCYQRLPGELRSRFSKTDDDAQVTHYAAGTNGGPGGDRENAEDDEWSLFPAAALSVEVLDLGCASQPTENYTIDADPVGDSPADPSPADLPDTGNDFGGGDGGGAGATGAY
jgi:hypothetical protein